MNNKIGPSRANFLPDRGSQRSLVFYDPESCQLVRRIANVSADEAVPGEQVSQAFHDGLALK